MTYFNALNYSLSNEDTRLEFDTLENGESHVLAICGSGSRVIPLLRKNPRKVTVVDRSPIQLALGYLRFETVRQFDRDQFLGFWGYPAVSSYKRSDRRDFYYSLMGSATARTLISPLERVFEEIQWGPPLLEGRWEKTFVQLSKWVRRVLGEHCVKKMFSIEDPREFAEYMKTEFPRFRWIGILAALANARVFNALLYRGEFPKKNIKQSSLGFYIDCFDRLFAQGPARENFFLQLCFLGKLEFEAGLPFECERNGFSEMKRGITQAEILFLVGDLLDPGSLGGGTIEPSSVTKSFSFCSLSDVPSYLGPRSERSYLQNLRGHMTSLGRVVVRNYLRIPENLDLSGYQEITSQYSSSLQSERMQVYDVHVYQREGF